MLWKNLFDDFSPFLHEIQEALFSEIQKADFILGESVSLFEEEMEKLFKPFRAIAVASGTSALEMILLLLKLNFDFKSIILPAFGFFGVSQSLLRLHWHQVFIDIHPQGGYGPDWNQLEDFLKKNPGPQVLLLTHLFGIPVRDIQALDLLKNKYKLFVIEDNSQGFGSGYKKKLCGSLGDISFMSFYPSKILSAMGDAGMILAPSDFYLQIKGMRVFGDGGNSIGFNSRMDTLQAAILRVKFQYWNKIKRASQKKAARFEKILDPSLFFLPAQDREDILRVYPFFVAEMHHREKALPFFKKLNIPFRLYYDRLFFHYPFFQNYSSSYSIPFPLSESYRQISRMIAFPISFFQSQCDEDRFFLNIQKAVDLILAES